MLERPKTKIIATLGDPEPQNPTGEEPLSSTYRNGVCDLNQKELENPTLQTIVDLFFENEVDVIRINLAHIPLDFLEQKFRDIKNAILDAEKRYKRNIGVLADLPGPKIRFKTGNWLLPTGTLTVCFDEVREDVREVKDVLQGKGEKTQIEKTDRPQNSKACINLDEKPFYGGVPKRVTEQMLSEIQLKLANNPANPLLAFIGDNNCTLVVKKVEGLTLVCEVLSLTSMVVGNKKGFTVRGVNKPIGSFTDQDKGKLTRLLNLDYEGPLEERILSHVGISFCQSREDVRQVFYHIVKHLEQLGKFSSGFPALLNELPFLVAKIETEAGVKKLDEILDIADGAMVARGDLALEIETVDLPETSKHIVARCNLRGKTVIMATQMLESMKGNIECDRPEATDVFSAVCDGVDALLLSGETSSGRYPAHAIRKMQDLALRAEKFVAREISEDVQIQGHFNRLEAIKERVEDWKGRWDDIAAEYAKLRNKKKLTEDEHINISRLSEVKSARLQKQNSTDRISNAVCIMSADPEVDAIVAPTMTGRTARMLARFRPRVWVFAQPQTIFTGRKIMMDWGVMVDTILPVKLDSDIITMSRGALSNALANATVILICGIPPAHAGTTNLIQRWDPTP